MGKEKKEKRSATLSRIWPDYFLDVQSLIVSMPQRQRVEFIKMLNGKLDDVNARIEHLTIEQKTIIDLLEQAKEANQP